jgi:hypothetical protein
MRYDTATAAELHARAGTPARPLRFPAGSGAVLRRALRTGRPAPPAGARNRPGAPRPLLVRAAAVALKAMRGAGRVHSPNAVAPAPPRVPVPTTKRTRSRRAAARRRHRYPRPLRLVPAVQPRLLLAMSTTTPPNFALEPSVPRAIRRVGKRARARTERTRAADTPEQPRSARPTGCAHHRGASSPPVHRCQRRGPGPNTRRSWARRPAAAEHALVARARRAVGLAFLHVSSCRYLSPIGLLALGGSWTDPTHWLDRTSGRCDSPPYRTRTAARRPDASFV